jgi:hypothetical protein
MFNRPEEKPGFWRRQFSNDVTPAQNIFDVIIGVIAPVLCFIFDPVVFNNRFGDVPLSLDVLGGPHACRPSARDCSSGWTSQRINSAFRKKRRCPGWPQIEVGEYNERGMTAWFYYSCL